MRARRKLEVSTFPFLAVLLCTMGSLILLLLVIDRKAKKASLEKAFEASRLKNEKDNELVQVKKEEALRLLAKEKQLEKQISEAKSNWNKTQFQKKESKVVNQILQKEMENKKDSTTALNKKTVVLQDFINEKENKRDLSEKSAIELQKQLNRLEGLMNERQISKSKEQPSFSIVPYFGHQGTDRKPLYLECKENGILFHPDGLLFNPKENPGPLAAELMLRTDLLKSILIPTSDNPQASPYLMILIRPKGIANYWILQSILKQVDLEFGYELVDQEWMISIPENNSAPDPRSLVALASKAKSMPRPMPAPGNYASGGQLKENKRIGFNEKGNRFGNGPNNLGPDSKEIQPLEGPPGFPPGNANLPTSLIPENDPQGINPYAIPGKRNFPGQANFGKSNTGAGPQKNFGNGENKAAKSNFNLNPTFNNQDQGSDGQNEKAKGGTGGSYGIAEGNRSTLGNGNFKTNNGNNSQSNSKEALAPDNLNPNPKNKGNANPKETKLGQNTVGGQKGQPSIQNQGPPVISITNQKEEPVDPPQKRTTYSPNTGFEEKNEKDPLNNIATPLPELGPRKSKSPSPLKPARLFADRDWTIYLECKFDELILHPSQIQISAGDLGKGNGLIILNEEIKKMIEKKQKTVRKGDPPYRPQIRFVVWPDGLRSYHLAYPVMESMKLPQSRQNLDNEDNLQEVMNRR